MAALTAETRNEIIKRLAARPGANLANIARLFGLSRQRIQNIVAGNRTGRTGRTRTGARTETRTRDYSALLAWIIEYKRAHDGNSPTYREIGQALGMTAPASYDACKRLERDGKLSIIGGRIHITGGCWSINVGSCEEVSNA